MPLSILFISVCPIYQYIFCLCTLGMHIYWYILLTMVANTLGVWLHWTVLESRESSLVVPSPPRYRFHQGHLRADQFLDHVSLLNPG